MCAQVWHRQIDFRQEKYELAAAHFQRALEVNSNHRMHAPSMLGMTVEQGTSVTGAEQLHASLFWCVLGQSWLSQRMENLSPGLMSGPCLLWS